MANCYPRRFFNGMMIPFHGQNGSASPGLRWRDSHIVSRRKAAYLCVSLTVDQTKVREMGRYSKYTTTVIGAYSVPDWFEPLDRLLAVGQLAMASMADAQFRASQAAVLDQEIAGVDVLTGGEMHRRTHNRHSPPNAMLNHFWQKIPAFQGSTRPKPITTIAGTRSIFSSPMS
jgi:hypothetical protein